MTNIIDIAREVGSPAPKSLCGQTDYLVITPYELERFAEFVRADEREVCAELIEALPCDCCWPEDSRPIAEDFADAIRDRSNT